MHLPLLLFTNNIVCSFYRYFFTNIVIVILLTTANNLSFVQKKSTMKIASGLLRTILTFSLASSVISDTNYGFAGEIFSNEADFEAFDQMSVGDRIILVNKNKWPECMIDSKLNNATECKAHIDAELEAMQLEVPIESVIIWTRTKDSPTSNAIVIPIDGEKIKSLLPIS